MKKKAETEDCETEDRRPEIHFTLARLASWRFKILLPLSSFRIALCTSHNNFALEEAMDNG